MTARVFNPLAMGYQLIDVTEHELEGYDSGGE